MGYVTYVLVALALSDTVGLIHYCRVLYWCSKSIEPSCVVNSEVAVVRVTG